MPRVRRPSNPAAPTGLEWALPPVRAWFFETFGTPTAAQLGGWPAIADRRHTLICAPTGTGKTLAAFLACLDAAWRAGPSAGTSILYVSPLKALNRDIAVNLEAPLLGISRTAERLGGPLRPLAVGVRTGDTPAAERRAQARRPPDILITTPESLHLLLSSGQREALRSVTHVIVDEIHDLCSNKRGVGLALLLERLERLCPASFVRIGLSATLNPIDAAARFLGGRRVVADGSGGLRSEPRPVAVVDAGVSKRIELTVASASRSAGRDGGEAGLEARLLDLIRSHRSALIFVNHRAEAERLTARLNALASRGRDPAEAREVARAHHGSLGLDRRRETEEALKRGELAAVVATASLELGIDVGAIDRVCQVGSPGSVARGLQRVGRAGHSAGEVSRAHLFARGDAELIELAALAGAMQEGAVEPVRTPRDCLDVLAQQIVACVGVEPWDAAALFALVRGADPYRDLPIDAFESVVALLSGRSEGIDPRDLRPRIRWDRLSNRLEPLPGTRRLALMGGNTIPDSGRLPVVLEGGGRVGEFDEDFVMERRVGDAVLLGTSTWVIRSIDARRVVVAPAEGRTAVVPFWRGEGLGRSAALGERVGRLRREVAARIDEPGLADGISRRYAAEPAAASRIVALVARQLREAGVVPHDRQVVIEWFLDQAGVANVLLQTPFGSRFHLGLKLVLQGRLRDRLGSPPAGHHADDGLVLLFPGSADPPTDLLDGLAPEDCEAYLLRELADSPLFRLRFRQVAARALLEARPGPSPRPPLWFQRFRSDELLGRLARSPDHPLIREAVRECLADDLDLDGLRAFLGKIRDGSIAVTVDRSGSAPSPFGGELIRRLSALPGRGVDRLPARRRGRRRGELAGLDAPRPEAPDLAAVRIDPDAVLRVESRLRGAARPPRNAAELAELLRFCGDLSAAELPPGTGPMLEELADRGDALKVSIPGASDPERWIAAEALPDYRAAFPDGRAANGSPRPDGDAAIGRIVRAYLRSHALVGVAEIVRRYGVDRALAGRLLGEFVRSGEVVAVPGAGGADADRWAERRNFDDLRGISVALRRRDTVAVEPEVFADLLVRHHLDGAGESRSPADSGLEAVLRRLLGFAAPAGLWESELLPRRLPGVSPARIDAFLRTEPWAWRRVEEASGASLLTLLPLAFEGSWPEPAGRPPLSPDAERLLGLLRAGGRLERDELAARSGLDPIAAETAIGELAERGLIGGDHLDPIRRSLLELTPAPTRARSSRRARAAGGRRGPGRLGRSDVVSGVRWAALRTSSEEDPGSRGSLEAWAFALLDRYGVLCRETAGLDGWAPPWPLLRGVLDEAELRGDVRRGYFVAGLSGVQFALESFADRLRRHRPEQGDPAPVLLASLDPANLYGPGAPLPLPPSIRWSRSPSSHLVLLRGRPVVLSEGFGRSLTILPWAKDDDVARALAALTKLAGRARKAVTVRRIDGLPALESRHAAGLIAAGFVRNPPGLAYYVGWSPDTSAW